MVEMCHYNRASLSTRRFSSWLGDCFFFEVFSYHIVQYPTWKDSDSKLSIESSLQAVRVSRPGFMRSSSFILVTLFGRTSAGWPKKHLDIWGAGA